MMQFKSIVLRNWRQFRSVNISFHPRLTVIAGANGSGKSTILNILSQHVGFSRPYLATPIPNKSGGYSYDAGFFIPSDELEDEPLLPLQVQASYPPLGMPGGMTVPGQVDVGRLGYANGVTAGLMVPREATAYGLAIHPQQPVNGIHINSHRIMATYQPVQGVAMQAMQLDQAYHLFNNEVMARYNGQQTGLTRASLGSTSTTMISTTSISRRGRNALDGITRLLLFDGRRLPQVIEGCEEA